MIKRLLFAALLLLLTPLFSLGQDPTYGDELLKWVKSQGVDFSQRLMEADYRSRLLNIHLTHYEQSFNNAGAIGRKLDSLQKKLVLQEPDSTQITDSTQFALTRAAQAQEALNGLQNVLAEIEALENEQQKLDGLATKRRYSYSGLYHVTKENVLASIVELGSSLSKNLRADYRASIGFTQGEGEDPQAETSGTSSDEVLNYVSIAATVGACYFPPLAIIPLVIGTNEIVRYYKKVEAQNLKVTQALEFFEKSTPPIDSTYRFYVTEYAKNKVNFGSLEAQLDSITSQLRASWKNLYKFQAYRLETAKLFLTEKKVNQLRSSYQIDGAVRKLFNAEVINTLNLDLNRQFNEVRSLEKNLLKETEQTKRLIVLEEYNDAMYEAKAWYAAFRHQPALIPLYGKIDSYDSVLTIKLKASEVQPNAKSTIDQGPSNIKQLKFVRGIHGTAFSGKPLRQLKKFDRAIASFAAGEQKDIQKKVTGLSAPSSPNGQPYLGYNNGNYEISATYSRTFNGRYPDGSGSINAILSGTADGGYRSDARAASGIDQITKASENLNLRITQLSSDYEALTKIKDTWQQAIAGFTGNLVTSINQSSSTIASQFENFRNMNEAQVTAISGSLNSFLSRPLTINSLQRFLMQNQGYAAAINRIQPSQIRPGNTPMLGQRLGQTAYPAHYTRSQNEILREGYKSQADMPEVRDRLARSLASGTADPVFSSQEQYDDLKMLFDNSMRYAKYFSDVKNEFVKRRPMSSATISNGYLHQARLLRYYSKGLITSANFRDYSVFDREILSEEYKKLILEFDNTCNTGNAGDAQSPCNRFVANALKSIYNVEDFLSITTDSRQIPLANQIFEKVSTSPNWHRIGPANNQESNYEASLRAAQGHPVIAVQRGLGDASGHVCMVLPGMPRERSGNPGYGSVLLVNVASWFVGHPEMTFYDRKISFAFGNADGVTYFYRDNP